MFGDSIQNICTEFKTRNQLGSGEATCITQMLNGLCRACHHTLKPNNTFIRVLNTTFYEAATLRHG
jgi:hypothetical protein